MPENIDQNQDPSIESNIETGVDQKIIITGQPQTMTISISKDLFIKTVKEITFIR